MEAKTTSFNLKKIFESQLVFDKILMDQKAASDRYSHIKIVVATLVEICEFANEFASFKYWKKNHFVNREKLLDEFSDCIHFFGSLANQTASQGVFEAKIVSQDLSEQLYAVIGSTHSLGDNFNSQSVEKALSLLLGLAVLLGITHDELMTSYYKKQENNLKRITGSY